MQHGKEGQQGTIGERQAKLYYTPFSPHSGTDFDFDVHDGVEPGDEILAPLDDETKDEIDMPEEEPEDADFDSDEDEDETDINPEEFDEEAFDELGESFLRKNYNNVQSYKTTKVTCSYTIRHFRPIVELNCKQVEVIFNDEPDKYYIGTPAGSSAPDPGKNAITAEWELLCPDPFKRKINVFETSHYTIRHFRPIVEHKGWNDPVIFNIHTHVIPTKGGFKLKLPRCIYC